MSVSEYDKDDIFYGLALFLKREWGLNMSASDAMNLAYSIDCYLQEAGAVEKGLPVIEYDDSSPTFAY